MHCDIHDVAELRCSGCRVLLARRERNENGAPAIMVRRADVFVDVEGHDASVQVICYRCGAKNTFAVRPSARPAAPLEHPVPMRAESRTRRTVRGVP